MVFPHIAHPCTGLGNLSDNSFAFSGPATIIWQVTQACINAKEVLRWLNCWTVFLFRTPSHFLQYFEVTWQRGLVKWIKILWALTFCFITKAFRCPVLMLFSEIWKKLCFFPCNLYFRHKFSQIITLFKCSRATLRKSLIITSFQSILLSW